MLSRSWPPKSAPPKDRSQLPNGGKKSQSTFSQPYLHYLIGCLGSSRSRRSSSFSRVEFLVWHLASEWPRKFFFSPVLILCYYLVNGWFRLNQNRARRVKISVSVENFSAAPGPMDRPSTVRIGAWGAVVIWLCFVWAARELVFKPCKCDL